MSLLALGLQHGTRIALRANEARPSHLPASPAPRAAAALRSPPGPRKAPAQAPARRALHVCAAAASPITSTAAQPVVGPDGQPTQFPGVSGVYAVYDVEGTLQYIGLSRKIAISVATHLEALPELVHSVKVAEMPDGSRDELTDAWKAWVQEAVQEAGAIPPGNAPGETRWQQRRPRPAKPEIRLTPGKGVEDLTCTMEELVGQVVAGCKVVAFVKGTRTAPQCGFSHKMLTILTESGTDFEVVNVLDEIYNPGLRDSIKAFSQWPTIPQLYVGGEFVGGADIVEEMHGSGELRSMLQALK